MIFRWEKLACVRNDFYRILAGKKDIKYYFWGTLLSVPLPSFFSTVVLMTQPAPENKHVHSDERAIIDSIRSSCNFTPSPVYPLDIGDDAAVRRCREGEQITITGDTLVDEIDFRLTYMSLREVGFKAMAVNVSDCAAMGADPESALVQVIAPREQSGDMISQLYEGIGEAGRMWGFSVIGGDLSAGPRLAISVTMFGVISGSQKPIVRSGARVGDGIWVSGFPGRSAAGLQYLSRHGRELAERMASAVVDSHVRPRARVKLGRSLIDDPHVHCMIDVSDGISRDAARLSTRSDAAFVLEGSSLGTDGILQEAAAAIGAGVEDLVLHGGEDFELLFSADSGFDPSVHQTESIPLHKIGTVVEGRPAVFLRDTDGVLKPVAPRGFDHFEG